MLRARPWVGPDLRVRRVNDRSLRPTYGEPVQVTYFIRRYICAQRQNVGMPTKVAELRQDHRGDRSQCVLCNPREDRIREDQIWAFIQRQPEPGVSPWR
jgi:hypothetical protein